MNRCLSSLLRSSALILAGGSMDWSLAFIIVYYNLKSRHINLAIAVYSMFLAVGNNK